MATGAQPEREIRGSIEWFGDDCACARCGSSASWFPCWNCDHGQVTYDGPEGWEEGEKQCDFCVGTGGAWHCFSSPKYCEEHPIAGREHIKSTALNPEAWKDVF